MADNQDHNDTHSAPAEPHDPTLVPQAPPVGADKVSSKLSDEVLNRRPSLGEILDRIERAIGEEQLENVCACRLRERFYLLDAMRVGDHLLAQVTALHPNITLESAECLYPAIDNAIHALLIAAQSEEIGHVDPYETLDAPHESEFIYIMQSMGIESALIGRAARRFNSLADNVREAFFSIVMNGEKLDACVSRGLGSKVTIGDSLHLSFTALLTTEQLDVVRRLKYPKR